MTASLIRPSGQQPGRSSASIWAEPVRIGASGVVLLICWLLASCGPCMLDCRDGPRMELKCSAADILREKVRGANVNIGHFGAGFEYADRLAGQATDTSFKMAMRLRALCDEYNSCIVSLKEYRRQSEQIRGTLASHLGIAEQLQGGNPNPTQLLRILFELLRNLGLPVPPIPPGMNLPGMFPFPGGAIPLPRPPLPNG